MQKLKVGIIITLYLALFIHHYIDVPYFSTLYVFVLGFLLIVSWKETSDFNKAIDAIPYDFRIQQARERSKNNTLWSKTVSVLCLILPFFIEFPFEQREGADSLFIFIFFGVVVGYYTLLIKPQYDYYLFGEQVITGPGPQLVSFPWSEIKKVETEKKSDIFYINLLSGTQIFFDLNNYYSDRKWDEVMNYFQERDVRINGFTSDRAHS